MRPSDSLNSTTEGSDMTIATLVPIAELRGSNIASAYYGVNYALAWARRQERDFPYPYVLGRTIDGVDYLDEDEALEHVADLWEVVGHFRRTLEVPDWWVWLIDHVEEHRVYQRMLEHLDDITDRQASVEWSERVM